MWTNCLYPILIFQKFEFQMCYYFLFFTLMQAVILTRKCNGTYLLAITYIQECQQWRTMLDIWNIMLTVNIRLSLHIANLINIFKQQGRMNPCFSLISDLILGTCLSLRCMALNEVQPYNLFLKIAVFNTKNVRMDLLVNYD